MRTAVAATTAPRLLRCENSSNSLITKRFCRSGRSLTCAQVFRGPRWELQELLGTGVTIPRAQVVVLRLKAAQEDGRPGIGVASNACVAVGFFVFGKLQLGTAAASDKQGRRMAAGNRS